jgi:hypothetical protein
MSSPGAILRLLINTLQVLPFQGHQQGLQGVVALDFRLGIETLGTKGDFLFVDLPRNGIQFRGGVGCFPEVL